MRLLLFYFMLAIHGLVQAQSAPASMNFGSYAIKLSVSKDECLVLTNRIGEVAISAQKQSNWRRADVHNSGNFLAGVTLEQSIFFNKDTGFVSGLILGGVTGNIIYHTTNGGLNWQPIEFGHNGCVDDVIGLDNGEAWMSSSDDAIAYTSDYGLSWKKRKQPGDKQRFTTIFFTQSGQVLLVPCLT